MQLIKSKIEKPANSFDSVHDFIGENWEQECWRFALQGSNSVEYSLMLSWMLFKKQMYAFLYRYL